MLNIYLLLEPESQAARPAGLSRVNGVRRSSASTWTSTLRQGHNFISIDLTFGVSDYVREVTSSDKVSSGPMSGRDATSGQHRRVLRLFIFFNRATAHTCEPIFVHNSSKDAFWWKEDPFGMRNVLFWNLGCFTPKTPPKIGRKGQLPAKMSNNSETVRNTRNVSMNHDYETGVALSDSVNKTCVKRP